MHSQHGILRARAQRAAHMACVAGLSAALVLGATPIAFAATSKTESQLARLTSEVSSATETFSKASSRASELQQQVDQLADEIITLEQETLPAQQALAADAAVNLYKMHSGNAGAISMLLGAKDFDDFIALGKYLDTIQSANTQALESLNELRSQMESKMDELSSAKDEAIEQERVAADALSRAKDAQSAMASKAAAEDAEAARAAEEARQQIEQAEQQAQANQGSASAPQTGQPQAPSQPQQPQPQPQPQPSQPQQPQQPKPEKPQGDSNQNQSGWLTGVASYYGIGDGFMGGTTASGEIVTETSMGIAMLGVPFGTRVEISFRGRSVIAYVNDRGPYVHGRVIDMQPAVARALNFLSVGVGTVQYRFL